MISNKTTQHFWSQLLVSMIAIFALPAAQGLEYNADVRNENYQSQTQYKPQQILTMVRAVQQIQTHRQTGRNLLESVKLFKIEPHFYASVFPSHAPIRGSPNL